MNEISFWGITFQVTLFAILSYKLYELTKLHIIPFLKVKIKYLKKQKTELIEKDKFIQSSLRNVEEQIISQQKTLYLINKKFYYKLLLQ